MSISIHDLPKDQQRNISDLTMEYLSKVLIIPTKNVLTTEFLIRQWITTGAIGGCVWGRPRIGKTHAMEYISHHLSERFGKNFHSFIWNISDHPDTEKSFYASIMLALGYDTNLGRAAIIIKNQLLNILTVMANETPHRKVVMFIDEAWQLTTGDFSRLMDLYNNLALRKVHLCCFLFGNKELNDLRDLLKNQNKNQIIGRFMVHEKQFTGIQTKEDLAFILCELDRENMILETEEKSETSILKYYFPYAENESFYNLTQDYWEAFQRIRSQYGLVSKDIPMQYIMESFILCLERYGVLSNDSVYFPTQDELYDCIVDSGYGESNE